ncbi:amidase [Planctobacterium marinum]|uniref:Amidase n=1 Tax=Planctobacterium marinum TaxID=1631968 RepID=A0AA48HJB2_9ALTE|nr:amidase [Planctobacterium marinum]
MRLASSFAIILCLLFFPSLSWAHPKLNTLSISEARELMLLEKLSSERLTKFYLEQIALNNKRGAGINAVVQINSAALDSARTLDEERRKGKVRGPLHGIPILLKDNIDTGDGMANTAGSIALANNIPDKDAQLVSVLREAGAVILGKTNLSEWANFRSFHSTSGWSSLYGLTKNPIEHSRNTCGSSSGSAAAVAAGFAMVAIGTETNGSIVCPSAATGLVGIKPTLGTVSRDGIIPIAHSQDTAGPMARNVADAVYLLEAMHSFNEQDPLAQHANSNLSVHLKANGLQDKRIGVATNLAGFHFGVDALFDNALALMSTSGATLIDIEMPDRSVFSDDEFTVLLFEFKHGLNHYLKQANLPHTLASLMEFNIAHHKQTMPFFKQEIFELAEKKGPLSEQIYLSALERSKRLAGPEGIDLVMQRYQLDLIVSPTTAPAWKTDLVNGDHYMGGTSSFAAVSGYPHITVPMGHYQGLPVGISMFAGHLAEPVLIEAAYGFESRLKAQ